MLAELHDRGIDVSYYAVWNFLDRAGLSYKKTLHAAEQDRPDIARRRALWQRPQGKIDARRIIFIDETWAKMSMTRRHGRSRVGQRLLAKVPHGHWKTPTFVAGLRYDGVVAPCVFNRPINATSSLAWVVQCLVPTLRSRDILVMDNLSSHKSRAVRRAIREVGAKLFFLPPYSPDLNPIEQAFAKLKTLFRKENARTVEQTTHCIGKLINQITPSECINYFRKAGYST